MSRRNEPAIPQDLLDQLLADATWMKRMIADRGYDANRLRATLKAHDTIPAIPGRSNRKRPIQYDERRYKDLWRIGAVSCRLKDFRRVATRYDKRARNFLSAVQPAAATANRTRATVEARAAGV